LVVPFAVDSVPTLVKICSLTATKAVTPNVSQAFLPPAHFRPAPGPVLPVLPVLPPVLPVVPVLPVLPDVPLLEVLVPESPLHAVRLLTSETAAKAATAPLTK
jgi:hypothetical protein